MQPFANRHDAGVELAAKLQKYRGRTDVVVLALPRGGVPVAFEIAEALDAPLDIFVVRKLGMPGHAEFAMGAIASGGVRVLSEDVIRWYGIPNDAVEAVARQELAEMERREREYRQGRTLTVCLAEVFGIGESGREAIATMLSTIISRPLESFERNAQNAAEGGVSR